MDIAVPRGTELPIGYRQWLNFDLICSVIEKVVRKKGSLKLA